AVALGAGRAREARSLLPGNPVVRHAGPRPSDSQTDDGDRSGLLREPSPSSGSQRMAGAKRSTSRALPAGLFRRFRRIFFPAMAGRNIWRPDPVHTHVRML